MPTAYAQVADLTNYGLSAATLGQLTSGQQTAAVNAANGVVDSYLGSKFKLPIVAFGPEMTRAAAILAAYDLIVIRGFDPEDPGDRTFYERQRDVTKWLEQISKGEVTPASVVDSSPSAAAGAPGTTFVQQATTSDFPQQGASMGGQQTTTPSGPNGATATLGAPVVRGWH